jgi:hypothetical protein
MQDYDHLAATCKPHCSASQVDPARIKLISADVSLGVGAAAVTTAAILLFGRAAASRSTEVQVTPQRSGAGVVVVHHF